MKDKRSRHGTVGKSSLEQRFRKFITIPLSCEISGALAIPSATGSYGKQAASLLAGW